MQGIVLHTDTGGISDRAATPSRLEFLYPHNAQGPITPQFAVCSVFVVCDHIPAAVDYYSLIVRMLHIILLYGARHASHPCFIFANVSSHVILQRKHSRI